MKQVKADPATGRMVGKIRNRTRLMYAFAIALDVLINNIINGLKNLGGDFRQEKRRAFKQILNAARGVDDLYETFCEKILMDGVDNYAEYDGYRKDANELIRLAMMYINCIKTEEDYQELMKFFEDRKPGPDDTLFEDDIIKMFELKV